MEPPSVSKNIKFSNTNPTKPGLYIYVRAETRGSIASNYTPTSLVEIKEVDGRLIADSDSLYRNMPLDIFLRMFHGKWSKRICFEEEE